MKEEKVINNIAQMPTRKYGHYLFTCNNDEEGSLGMIVGQLEGSCPSLVW